jgi:hypothetical protein
MNNSFVSPISRGLPVNRKGLRACSSNHPHEFVGVSLWDSYGFIEDLNSAIFIDSSYKPNLPATERQGMNKADTLWKNPQTDLEKGAFSLPDQSPLEVAVVGLLEGLGTRSQLPNSSESIPFPDLLLPKPVVAFDLGIGSGPMFWGKDWNHPTSQAESNQLPQTPGMYPASRQAHVVVHLQKDKPGHAELGGRVPRFHRPYQ